MAEWTEVCAADDIDDEDLIRWDYEGRSFAVYNTEDGFSPPTAIAPMNASISATGWSSARW